MYLIDPFTDFMKIFGVSFEEAVFICHNCGGDICEDERYLDVDGRFYCEYCMADMIHTA